MRQPALFLLVAVLLGACRAAPVPQPPPAPPAAVPPTDVPAPTPTPALVESPAGSVNDLAGIWIFTVKLQFRTDGTFHLYFGSDSAPEMIDEGSYAFGAGKLTFVKTAACKDSATYRAYVTRQGGKPIWLRLKVVGNDRCTGRADILSRAGKFYKP